ncbi:MAG: hypothetical protein AAC993_01400 [Dehalococcoides mccartyi]|uniref:hypothetical protein n=1 Tax=Dehalococcoides mccartyi TaxID=61435 RepID=UPI0030FAD11E
MNVDILKQYLDKIQSAPEQSVIREIDSLKWSFKIFAGNYVELIKLLKFLEDRPESTKLWDVKRKQDLYRMFEEIGRLLFNYLAAASMLIDHTRRCIKKLYRDQKYLEFSNEYEKEKNRLADSDTHQIAQGLRNYIQHRNLPAIGSKITYTPETGLNKAFRILSQSLLEWDKWSPAARRKLQSMGESFPLRDFVEDYFNQVDAFYKWLGGKQTELHRVDVERLNGLKEDAKLAFKQAGMITERELKELDN